MEIFICFASIERVREESTFSRLILFSHSICLLFIIGSAHSLGAILGCLLSIPALERLGRRGAALYVMSLAYIIGEL